MFTSRDVITWRPAIHEALVNSHIKWTWAPMHSSEILKRTLLKELPRICFEGVALFFFYNTRYPKL